MTEPVGSGGPDLLPPLHWTGKPLQTCTWLLVFEDPNTAAEVWQHVLLFGDYRVGAPTYTFGTGQALFYLSALTPDTI